MRIALFIAALAVVTAATATETPRAPGAYTSLTTANASACARACADDGICMAWSFHQENQCQLSAVVGAPAHSNAIATGYASRAPANLQPRTPVVEAEALRAALPAEQTETEAPTEDHPVVVTRQEDDGMLLGGPEEGDLRLGLR